MNCRPPHLPCRGNSCWDGYARGAQGLRYCVHGGDPHKRWDFLLESRTCPEEAGFPDLIFMYGQVFVFVKYLFIWLLRVSVAAGRILSCGLGTLSCSMWGLVPWLGIEPRLPELCGSWVLATGPPGKSLDRYFEGKILFSSETRVSEKMLQRTV